MPHFSNKKRQTSNESKKTYNQNKRSKLEDRSNDIPKKGGLFDNDSDEEMDPNVLESVMQQLNDDDSIKSASESNSDDDMDVNDNNNNNQSDDDDDDDDDYSITSTDIPEVDPVSDLLHEEIQDRSHSEDDDHMTADDNESQHPDQASPSTPPTTKHNLSGKFRDHYMGQMTLAFGSDLDTIRQEPGFTAARLNVLIDSLESGITIFTDLEKNIVLANANDN